MWEKRDRLSPRQLMALGFVCALSPLIRRLPSRAAALAGGGAWASVLLVAVPLGLLFGLARSCLQGGRSLPAGIREALGGTAGRLVLGLYALWFVFLTAYTLRSDAERFMTTVYPGSGPAVFVVTLVLACLPAALGHLRSLGGAAMLFRPLLTLVLLFVFAFALPQADLRGLWQLSPEQETGVLLASLDTFSPIATSVFLIFLAGRVEPGLREKHMLGWLATLLLLAEGLCVATIGSLGVEQSARVCNPFFALAGDITLFGSIEHLDAVLVTVWVFSDFVEIAALLVLSGQNLGYALSAAPEEAGRHSRLYTALCALSAGVLALTMAPNAQTLELLVTRVAPAGNLALAFTLLPLLLLVKRRRA